MVISQTRLNVTATMLADFMNERTTNPSSSISVRKCEEENGVLSFFIHKLRMENDGLSVSFHSEVLILCSAGRCVDSLQHYSCIDSLHDWMVVFQRHYLIVTAAT